MIRCDTPNGLPNPGDTAWMMTAATLVFIQTPAIGILQGFLFFIYFFFVVVVVVVIVGWRWSVDEDNVSSPLLFSQNFLPLLSLLFLTPPSPAGMIRRKNSLSTLLQAMAGVAIGSILWMIWGFSLTFGEDHGVCYFFFFFFFFSLFFFFFFFFFFSFHFFVLTYFFFPQKFIFFLFS